VLKYRVARTNHADEKDPAKMADRIKNVIPLAIADGQLAIRLVRSRAADWGIAKDRGGILGFSAGGYVAASSASSRCGEPAEFRGAHLPRHARGVTPPPDAPPLFLVHADDDGTVPPLQHTIRLYEAWKKAGIPAEVHIYSRGGPRVRHAKEGFARRYMDRSLSRLACGARVAAMLFPGKRRL
jgi:predicted esterase